MPKFSISTLLWLVSVCAMVIAVVITQRTLRNKNSELAIAGKQIMDYRNLLGEIEIVDPAQYHIRHFKDPFSYDTEFRWRIYSPDASQCNIYYAVGKLPEDGFPKEWKTLVSGGLPKGAKNLILITENRKDRGGSGHFRIRLYPEFGTKEFFPMQGRTMRSVDWIPWFQNATCMQVNPPQDSTTVFKLDEPFVIMKHYTTNKNDELIGYMFWIAETAAASSE